MGYVMQTEHPRVIEVVDRAICQIADAGRVAGALGLKDAMLERTLSWLAARRKRAPLRSELT